MGPPIAASPMVEVKKVVENMELVLLQVVSTPAIAKAVKEVLSKPKSHWRNNCPCQKTPALGADAHIILEQLEGAMKQPWVRA